MKFISIINIHVHLVASLYGSTSVLQAERSLGSHITRGHLTAQYVFGGREDCRPILKSRVGHSLALAVGHQIYNSVSSVVSESGF